METNKKEIKALIGRQRDFFAGGGSKNTAFRIKQLEILKALITDNEQDILAALKRDLGKASFEAYLSEIVPVLQEIDFALKNIDKWTKPDKVKTPLIHFPSSSHIYPEPYGVALIIGPWNYPFQLIFSPLVGAIAAGNCAVLKPSQFAESTTALTAELVKKYFDSDYISVAEGKDVSRQLLEEEFDYIFFTGSTKVGKLVMKAAAEYLTPVTLELGGKSPCIVHESADIENTAGKIVWGKFINAGQTCVAPDYIYVHSPIKEALIEALKKKIVDFYGDSPEDSADYGRIINKNNFERLTALLKSGKIIHGGNSREEDLFVEPTILDNVSWNDPVMQEEIFGPLLPILEFQDLDEVIEGVRKSTKPLALYIFAGDNGVEEKIIENLSFGGGCVNNVIMHLLSPYLPFGGVGASGTGAYHGKSSFDTFTHYKSILKSSPKFDLQAVSFPPYKERLLPVLKKTLHV